MGSDLAMHPLLAERSELPRRSDPPRRCGTCAHWRDPADNDRDWGPRVDWSSMPEETVVAANELELKAYEVERLYGECVGVPFLLTEMRPERAPLAFTQDVSKYVAVLYTRAEFGCALWSPK